MPLSLLFILVALIAAYWVYTQVLPQRRRNSALRPALADGLLASLNGVRQERGLPVLRVDADLTAVAEGKALHHLTTAEAEEGWHYPAHLRSLLGQSLLLESLFTGALPDMLERIQRQREVLGEEWQRCGLGVAVGQGSGVVVAMILSREPWTKSAEGEVSDTSQSEALTSSR